MYTLNEFQSDVIRIAMSLGYKIERLRGTNIPQIDFGHKKLHGKHIRALFPDVLAENVNINKLIEEVAPGRPCAHRPFRIIVMQIKSERPNAYAGAIQAGKGV